MQTILLGPPEVPKLPLGHNLFEVNKDELIDGMFWEDVVENNGESVDCLEVKFEYKPAMIGKRNRGLPLDSQQLYTKFHGSPEP